MAAGEAELEELATKLRGIATQLIGEPGKDQEWREAVAEELRELAGVLEAVPPPAPEV